MADGKTRRTYAPEEQIARKKAEIEAVIAKQREKGLKAVREARDALGAAHKVYDSLELPGAASACKRAASAVADLEGTLVNLKENGALPDSAPGE